MRPIAERRLAMRLMLGDAAIDLIIRQYSRMARIYADASNFEKAMKPK